MTIIKSENTKNFSILGTSTIVDIPLLDRLAKEGDYCTAGTIEWLALLDFPMSDDVIELGVLFGVLLPGYHVGWSNEIDAI